MDRCVLFQVPHPFFQSITGGENRQGFPEEETSCLRQPYTFRKSVKKNGSAFFLQLPHGVGYGRLGDIQNPAALVKLPVSAMVFSISMCLIVILKPSLIFYHE